METTNTQPAETKWVTKEYLAQHLQCSTRTINNLMHRRILPYVKIGRIVRFDQDACDRAMRAFQRNSILLNAG